MSQRRSGRLRSGTTAQAWYCLITSARVTLAFRRRPSTAQRSLSIFSYSFLAEPSDQFLCDFAVEQPLYGGSVNSGSFHK
jgi:hypothetical protein